jgi:hypothetical protein
MSDDFFANLTRTMQSPMMQQALMTISGTPYEEQAPRLEMLQKQEVAQQEQQARAMVEAILAKGDITDQDIARVYMSSPQLGKALVEMRKQQMEQQQMAQRQALLQQGGGGLEALAQMEALGGNIAPLIQLQGQQLGARKVTRDAYGNPMIMDVSNPDGGMTTPAAGGGSRTPDISMQDLLPAPTSGVAPPVDGSNPQQQALDEMASLGMPNTPDGWSAYGKYKDNQRNEITQTTEKNKKYEDLNRMESKIPELFSSVQKLSSIGEDATYTRLGSLKDEVLKETGFGATKGAVASSKYMATVRNQVLPLLRETFGAQFTVKEGESLLETLGAGYKSPAEKNAVLQSFIDQKVASVNSERRRVGLPEVRITPPQIENKQGGSFRHPILGNVTEENIKSTMKQTGLTREQVLQKIGVQ